MTDTTRRRLLSLGAGALTAGLAGCLGGGSDESETTTATDSDQFAAQASFYVLSEFAGAVAGETATVENLVPIGQHGHGWEPGADIQRRVFESDAFVYVGEGFQPWADTVVENLRVDAPDVAIIEARHGIDLLPAGGSSPTHDHGGETTESHDDHTTESHDDHTTESHDDHTTESHDDHDHAGASDPHFWLDPRRAKQAVENVRAGFAAADGANAAAYEEHAAAYASRLDDLDAQFEETLASRRTDTVLVAGHNAFQYLGDRYDVSVHALSGLSPDDTPSPQDVRQAQRVIDDHDVEYVLAPMFESDRAARQLVAETDASDVLPITSIPSTTEQWLENDWGYIEVMREVNLESLARALGAT